MVGCVKWGFWWFSWVLAFKNTVTLLSPLSYNGILIMVDGDWVFNQLFLGEMTKTNDLYLGYERWLPSPPKVKKPRSIYNAAALAYLGDCIYELYARRHFLFPPLSIEEFNDRVMAVVRCEAQDAVLQKLLSDNYLSQQERSFFFLKNISFPFCIEYSLTAFLNIAPEFGFGHVNCSDKLRQL
ncbi:uncharacterized protein LOC133794461 isoform X3 [Humulus lupulus]|uniref:uncharacterized protein LOC133794461 isoform X3 n=1 Tax=Humulus lupulus TaxID=3486 RepID=UPI002B4071E6|nr:uncharacterized protein LOC133794461 isoform X3 [Humulus lupulus]